MRKREFLRRLGQELSHLDRDERNDILDYYDELIEDTIEKTGDSESDVIYDLGSVEEIARKVDPSRKRRLRYEEEEEEPMPRKNRKRTRESSHSVLGIIITILCFPLWIAIFAALGGILCAIIGGGIGSLVGGIFCIWDGCTLFTTSWAQGLFRVGVGISILGIICIVAPLLIKILNLVGKLLISFIKWLFGGRRRYA